jgi:hypothetical protein
MFREGFTIEERELGKFSGAERETAILPVLEEEVKYSRQYRYPLYSLFPPKERTPETKPEALIISFKRKQSFSLVPVLPAPKMYPTKIFEKEIKKYIEPLESKQYAKLLLLTREPLPPPVYPINVGDSFIKPVIEVARLEYLNRNLDMLLENLDNNKFTIEDAEKFAEAKRIIKSREQVPSWLYEKYISVYTTYLEKLAAPSYSSSLAVLVLGILDEAKRPLSYREIKNEVEKILDRRLDKDSEFWLWLALEILVSPIKGVPLVKEKGIIFTKYELTNEGKIVAVIRKDDYEELKKNRGVYTSTWETT